MSIRIIIFCLSIGFCVTAVAQPVKNSQRYKYPLSKFEEIAQLNQYKAVKEFEKIELLKTIKYYIINGQLDRAKLLLKEATITEDFSKRIQYRYLAIINFIEGDYQTVVNIFNSKVMRTYTSLSRYCVLDIVSRLILNKKENFQRRWIDCKSVTVGRSKTNLIWLQSIVNIKQAKNKKSIDRIFKDLNIDNVKGEFLRIYLKLALYLNKQDKIIPRFEFFSQETLENSLYRELIGMNYYRNFDLVKAFQLLDTLDTPNAEVFKGNLYLFQKKYEAAYAQYKLALAIKDNSDNALERLIPLAWKLNQWDEGIQYVQRFNFTKDNLVQKNTLLAAFLLMSNKNIKVKKLLKEVQATSSKRDPIELTQLLTLSSITHNEIFLAQESAYSSCLKKDFSQCWFLFFNKTLDNNFELINSKKEIHNSDSDLVNLYSNSDIKDPIKEEVFIIQKDIEELDNDLIQLINNI